MNIPNYPVFFLKKYSTVFIQNLVTKSGFLVVNLPNVQTVENSTNELVYTNLMKKTVLITCRSNLDIDIYKKNLHKI